jgi:hypothetical protein
MRSDRTPKIQKTWVILFHKIKCFLIGSFFIFCVVLYVFIKICYIHPPQFNNKEIKICTDGRANYVSVEKDDILFQNINKWLAKKRWCYPSLVTYFPYLTLCDENPQEQLNTITFWDDRIIFQYGDELALQYISFFFTPDDKKIQIEIKNKYLQSMPIQQSVDGND